MQVRQRGASDSPQSGITVAAPVPPNGRRPSVFNGKDVPAILASFKGVGVPAADASLMVGLCLSTTGAVPPGRALDAAPPVCDPAARVACRGE